MGAALALAIVAPWLVWLPFVRGTATIDLLGALAIAGAWHGWGRLVARLARRDPGVVLAIYWGVAATIALAGVMIALHIYDARLLVIGGSVAHSIDLVLRWRDIGAPLQRPSRYALVPIAIIVVIAVTAVLGAAGQVTNHPFDDDGNFIAQLRRLADTGGLGDAIGYARTSQLGGHAALAGLATAFTVPNAARLVDGGLGLALLLALAYTRIRPRDAIGGALLVLLALTACAFVAPGTDLAPLWLPAGLLVALDATLGDGDGDSVTGGSRALVPLALLAAALAAIRTELALVGLAFAAGAWWLGRRDTRADLWRLAVLLGGITLAVLPYGVARMLAWHGVAAPVHDLVEPAHGSVLGRVALFVAIALAATPIALLMIRELEPRRLRVIAIACAVGVASVAAFGVRPYAAHCYWPLAIGGFVVLAAAIAPKQEPTGVALVLALLAIVLVNDAQAATKRLTSWSWRAYDLLFDVEYARHAAPEGGAYERLLAPVARGDTVAVWVSRPELLDYGQHRIVDLRTPRVARLRDSEKLADVVAGAHARWLLVEDDVPAALAALAANHPTPVAFGGVRLVDLR